MECIPVNILWFWTRVPWKGANDSKIKNAQKSQYMYQINFQLIFLGGLTPNPDFPVDITLSSTEFVSLHYPNLNQFGPELPGEFC